MYITNIKTYIYLQVFAFGNTRYGQTGVRIGEPVKEPTEIYKGTGECHCIILLQGLSKSNLCCLYESSLVSYGNNIFYHSMTEFKTPIYYFLPQAKSLPSKQVMQVTLVKLVSHILCRWFSCDSITAFCLIEIHRECTLRNRSGSWFDPEPLVSWRIIIVFSLFRPLCEHYG